MQKIKIVVHGLGNIGKCALEAIENSADLECLGVIRRQASLGSLKNDLRGLADFENLEALIKKQGKPEVVINCGPTREAENINSLYLKAGLNTVDSFDIHPQIPQLVKNLNTLATENNAVAITAAGWDPGSDSVFRAMLEAMAPIGTTFTNFGRGRSMGHSVAAKNINGVKEAVAITIPLGGGLHSRLVYVLLKENEDFKKVEKLIKEDDYFKNDKLTVKEVKSQFELHAVADTSHGVLMERIGASGLTSNQHFTFDMRIDNPSLTAQVMVSAARASTRLEKGAYTLIDIPPVKFLAGDRFTNIKKLV